MNPDVCAGLEPETKGTKEVKSRLPAWEGHDLAPMSTVTDGRYEQYLWELSGDWKIFDVRVFAK